MLTGPVLWPVAGQEPGSALGAPDAMTWSFPLADAFTRGHPLSSLLGRRPGPHIPACSLSAVTAPRRPAPSSGPLLGTAPGVPACGGQEGCKVKGPEVPGRPGFQAGIISSVCSVGPLPSSQNSVAVVSSHDLRFGKIEVSLLSPEWSFQTGGVSSACALYEPFLKCQERTLLCSARRRLAVKTF